VPVLIEAISVLVRRDAIDRKFTGGWPSFIAGVPNSTLCFDDEVVRVGFMSPEDVRSYVSELESRGLCYLAKSDTQDQDIAVVDQLQGFMTANSWLELANCLDDEIGGHVVICRLVGSSNEAIAVPDSWKYSGSMSEQHGFMTDEAANANLMFLRSDGGLDVYLNKITGKEVYIGRTSRSH
jgi:hypothetical protein